MVEDDIDVRPLLVHILVEEGHSVTAVETVGKAMPLLESGAYDLALTDVNLPDGNGLTIADRAKALGIRELVVTGHGLSLKPGQLAGYSHLLKPFRAAELLRGVRKRLA